MFCFSAQLTDGVKAALETEVTALFEAINNPSMKEVKGLEDRLFGLEQLLFGAKKIVGEQTDMAQVRPAAETLDAGEGVAEKN